jgi:hypothetical protein
VLGFRDDREQVLRRWLAGCQPLRLSSPLGIARHGGIAPPVALPLEETKHLPGVMTALVPGLEEEGFIGIQHAVPAPFIGPLRKGRAPERPKYGRFPNPQLLRNGLPGPALTA